VGRTNAAGTGKGTPKGLKGSCRAAGLRTEKTQGESAKIRAVDCKKPSKSGGGPKRVGPKSQTEFGGLLKGVRGG